MPKVSIQVDSSTGLIPVTLSAIQTNFAQTQYVLEGRIDDANIYASEIDTNQIVDAADATNPVVGEKYLGIDSATGGSPFKTNVFDEIETLFEDNIVPTLLEGKETFILTSDFRIPERVTEPATFEKKEFQQLVLGPIGPAVFDFIGVGPKKKNKENKSVFTRTISFKIPPSFTPIELSRMFDLWNDTSKQGDRRTLNLTVDKKYAVNAQIDINGAFAADVDYEKRPNIEISGISVGKDEVDIIIDVNILDLGADDYFNVSLIVQLFCEIRP